MKKVLSLLIAGLASGIVAFAQVDNGVPEIDANSAASALALLSGALLMLRGRRR
jgi:hypothetical protein